MQELPLPTHISLISPALLFSLLSPHYWTDSHLLLKSQWSECGAGALEEAQGLCCVTKLCQSVCVCPWKCWQSRTHSACMCDISSHQQCVISLCTCTQLLMTKSNLETWTLISCTLHSLQRFMSTSPFCLKHRHLNTGAIGASTPPSFIMEEPYEIQAIPSGFAYLSLISDLQ